MSHPAALRPDILDTLSEGIAKLTSSPEWMSFLRFQSRFHRYSFGNAVLIASQRPTSTFVAGFHRWLELDRAVMKGERGIRILAPVTRRLI